MPDGVDATLVEETRLSFDSGTRQLMKARDDRTRVPSPPAVAREHNPVGAMISIHPWITPRVGREQRHTNGEPCLDFGSPLLGSTRMISACIASSRTDGGARELECGHVVCFYPVVSFVYRIGWVHLGLDHLSLECKT